MSSVSVCILSAVFCRTLCNRAVRCCSVSDCILSAVFCRSLCNRAVCCCSVSVCILSAVFCRSLCNRAVCCCSVSVCILSAVFCRSLCNRAVCCCSVSVCILSAVFCLLIQKEKRKKGKAQGKAQDSKQKKKKKRKRRKKKKHLAGFEPPALRSEDLSFSAPHTIRPRAHGRVTSFPAYTNLTDKYINKEIYMTVNSTRDFIPPEPFEGQNYKPRYARPSASLREELNGHAEIQNSLRVLKNISQVSTANK